MLSEGSNAMNLFAASSTTKTILSFPLFFSSSRPPIFDPFSRLVFFFNLFSHGYKSEEDLNVETLQLSTCISLFSYYFAVLRRLYQPKMLVLFSAFMNSLE